MDYILADRYLIPPEAETHYCEKVLRLPDSYVCYDPPRNAPPVSPLPAREPGEVTLGCFNNPAKITPRVVEVWSRILRRLPQARLVLKYAAMSDPAVAGRFRDLFAAEGTEAGRLEFSGQSSHQEYLGWYQRIDLALDPFPFSGGATTCESLWMGVPVIAFPAAERLPVATR